MRSYQQIMFPEYSGYPLDSDSEWDYGYWNEAEFDKRPFGYSYQKKKIVREVLQKFLWENVEWKSDQIVYTGPKAFSQVHVTKYPSISNEEFEEIMQQEFSTEEIQQNIFGKAMTHKQFALVDFANEVLGGSVWGNGSAQEEKLFMEHPHLMLAVANARRELGFSHKREELDRSKQILIPQGGDGAIVTSPTPRLAELSIGFRIDGDAKHFKKFDREEQAEQAPHVVALAAKSFKKQPHGAYTIEELENLLKRAYTGFTSLKNHLVPGKPFAIETGPWGSGDFMNHYGVMYVIQILAAKMAGVERLDYFHRPGQEYKDMIEQDAKLFLKLIEGRKIKTCVSQLQEFAQRKTWFRGNPKVTTNQ